MVGGVLQSILPCVKEGIHLDETVQNGSAGYGHVDAAVAVNGTAASHGIRLAAGKVAVGVTVEESDGHGVPVARSVHLVHVCRVPLAELEDRVPCLGLVPLFQTGRVLGHDRA